MREIERIRNIDFSDIEGDILGAPSSGRVDPSHENVSVFSARSSKTNQGVQSGRNFAKGSKLPRAARRLKGLAASRAKSQGCVSEDEGRSIVAKQRVIGKQQSNCEYANPETHKTDPDSNSRRAKLRGYHSEDEGKIFSVNGLGCRSDSAVSTLAAFDRELMASTARVIAVEETTAGDCFPSHATNYACNRATSSPQCRPTISTGSTSSIANPNRTLKRKQAPEGTTAIGTVLAKPGDLNIDGCLNRTTCSGPGLHSARQPTVNASSSGYVPQKSCHTRPPIQTRLSAGSFVKPTLQSQGVVDRTPLPDTSTWQDLISGSTTRTHHWSPTTVAPTSNVITPPTGLPLHSTFPEAGLRNWQSSNRSEGMMRQDGRQIQNQAEQRGICCDRLRGNFCPTSSASPIPHGSMNVEAPNTGSLRRSAARHAPPSYHAATTHTEGLPNGMGHPVDRSYTARGTTVNSSFPTAPSAPFVRCSIPPSDARSDYAHVSTTAVTIQRDPTACTASAGPLGYYTERQLDGTNQPAAPINWSSTSRLQQPRDGSTTEYVEVVRGSNPPSPLNVVPELTSNGCMQVHRGPPTPAAVVDDASRMRMAALKFAARQRESNGFAGRRSRDQPPEKPTRSFVSPQASDYSCVKVLGSTAQQRAPLQQQQQQQQQQQHASGGLQVVNAASSSPHPHFFQAQLPLRQELVPSPAEQLHSHGAIPYHDNIQTAGRCQPFSQNWNNDHGSTHAAQRITPQQRNSPNGHDAYSAHRAPFPTADLVPSGHNLVGSAQLSLRNLEEDGRLQQKGLPNSAHLWRSQQPHNGQRPSPQGSRLCNDPFLTPAYATQMFNNNNNNNSVNNNNNNGVGAESVYYSTAAGSGGREKEAPLRDINETCSAKGKPVANGFSASNKLPGLYHHPPGGGFAPSNTHGASVTVRRSEPNNNCYNVKKQEERYLHNGLSTGNTTEASSDRYIW